MSRIIVKGLPKYLTEEKLRDHFAKKGDVTDVKLRKNKFGESRRFAFVGFKSTEDAEEAVKYFNGSFIDTAKIEVDFAKSFVDPTVPKSFREKRREALDRVRERESREQEREEQERERKRQKRERQNNKRTQIDGEIENDPKLKEFIETMKPSTQAKSWSNDVVINEGGAPSNSLLDRALAMKGDDQVENKFENKFADEIFKVQENESDDEYNDFGKDDAEEKVEDREDEQMMSIDDLGKPKDTNNEEISDLEWLKQRRIRVKENGEIPEEQKQEHQVQSQTESEAQPIKKQGSAPEPEPKESEEELAITKIQQTGRLFLRNILYIAKEEDFRELFSKYGVLEEVHIAIDTRNGQSKGFAYIKFQDPQDAIQAYIELDKQIFQGRLLHILPADGKKDHRLDEFDLKNLPLKKQRELKKKNDASKSTFSWNSLFMNTDAVMNSIAANLGIDKRELIDPESSNSAVKQALAEAHVIGDVRKFFESKGVDLTKFQGKERDDSIILIKNFPYGTTEAELIELFKPFGELKRIIMPPSGTIAIIQYRDFPSGRSAFTKLCYRRFKKGILYLEKGPKDLFTRESTDNEAVGASQAPVVQENVKEIKDTAADNIIDEDVEVFEGATVSVFVKNLNFSTTAQQLTELFKPLDGFIIATIKTKPDPRDSSRTLSMGFGFAEFKTKEQANVAIKTLDNTVLDGHKLQLKQSHRQNTVGKSSTTKNKSISSKIIVKNLPFEASRKDVFELFNSFGQLKSVRVPKKFDKSARGFAFVEFLLPKEAEGAMDQLQGVHLLGRRLVMQYSEQNSDDVEEEIEKMTKKVKKQVATQQIGSMRMNSKRKFELDDDEEGGVDDI